jgi:hypothetical protein
MTHVIEPATSGRARCRGCGRKIDKEQLRFGERQPNAFGDGEMTLWFHLLCAAYKRPEPFLEVLDDSIEGAENLRAAAELGLARRRLPRVDGAELAPTGRARCRSCRELIAKDTWRLPLVFFEEYRFQPSGFIHAACAEAYLGTTDLLDRAAHFNPDLDAASLEALSRAMRDDA